MAHHYAIVFTRDFPPGTHWSDGTRRPAPTEDSDRAQHWHAGDLYSLGSVAPATVPAHFTVVTLPSAPRPGERWNRETQRFELRPEDVTADVVVAVERALASIAPLSDADRATVRAVVTKDVVPVVRGARKPT